MLYCIFCCQAFTSNADVAELQSSLRDVSVFWFKICPCVQYRSLAQCLYFGATPRGTTFFLSLSVMCLSFFYWIPQGLGKEQAVAGVWPGERGLCKDNVGQNIMAREGVERSQSGPLTAAQWGPFRWWGTVGSGQSPLVQQGATDCHNKISKISRLPHTSPLCQSIWPHFKNLVHLCVYLLSSLFSHYFFFFLSS